jgi:DNA repair exonuclease SbcCD ATPase subunit
VIDEFDIDDQRETGFGTGLRAHLGYDLSAEPDLHPFEPELHADEPAAEAPLEPVEWDGDPDPVPDLSGPEQRARELESYAAELAEREQRLNELESELADESQRLAAADAMRTEARRPVRELLREHAEQYAERLVLTFEQALEATDHDGRPDFTTRLAALRLLLCEAYDETGGDASTPSRAEDELAELRRRRGLA